MTLTTRDLPVDTTNLMETAIVGDLGKLSPAQRVDWYGMVCKSLSLNPLTRPFDYVILNGKLTFYANKNCAEQLRALRGVSFQQIGDVRFEEGLVILKGRVTLPDGRTDEGSAAVSIKGLQGEHLANALMKCETKLKRRLTLSICGLGLIDETEVDSIAEARRVTVDHTTGEILSPEAATAQVVGELPPANDDMPLTSAQRVKIFASSRDHGWSVDELRIHLETTYGDPSTQTLTRGLAKELIEYIEDGNRPAVQPVPVPPEQAPLI